MNSLPSKVATQQVIREEKSSPPPTMVEEEAVEWGTEEEILKEAFESILLTSGGLEELDSNCSVSQSPVMPSEMPVEIQENRSITIEALFEVASFKDDFPDIYNQIDIHDWDPFTIPMWPYLYELCGVKSAHHPRGNKFHLLSDPICVLRVQRKVEDKENQFKWVAEIIAQDQPQQAVSKEIIPAMI
ncbi:hypothetical protein HAX54_036199 [Datura stramonium]|uniref:Uncharacterized protein n=1 Tax=Datura stramonium TaxID=4076 RepID=A0ABS8VIS7_DATST|nr:hypothetical protein [Datura stramonium]